MAFAQSVQLCHCARVGCLKLPRVFCLAREFGAQHGPTCLFRFMSREVSLSGCLSVEGRLQTQNLGAVGCGCFLRRMHFCGEGLDLALAGREFCSLCGELLGCSV